MDDQTAVAEPPLPPEQRSAASTPPAPATEPEHPAQPAPPLQPGQSDTPPVFAAPAVLPTPEPSAAAAAASAAATAAAASAERIVRGWLSGITGQQVKRALLEAAAVVGGALVALTVLLLVLGHQAAASGGPLEDLAPSVGDAARAATLVLGLAALGTVSFESELSLYDVGVTYGVGLTAAPLLLTGLLLAGWAVAARVGVPAADRRSAATSAVLSGLASGVVLAVVSGVGAITTLPLTGDRDVDDLLRAAVSFHLGVEPLRMLLTGALLAGVAAAVVRLWPHLRAGATADRWSRHLATWRLPLELAAGFVLLGGLATALTVVVLLATWEDGPRDLAGWAAAVALLPTMALAGLLVALGATVGLDSSSSGSLVSQLDGIGVLGDLPDLDRAGALRLGLLDGWHPSQLWWAPVGAAVVLAVVAVLTALRHDPRAQAQAGLWWRTGVVFAAAGAAITALTTVTVSLRTEPVASSHAAAGDFDVPTADLASSMVFAAGPALLGTLLCTFVAGALAAVLLLRLPRPLVAAAPRTFSAAAHLPGGVHPLWALLLVDATARLGRTAPSALQAQAGAAVSQAGGLVPLVVDPARSRALAVGAALVVGAGVGLPVAHHVVSTTVYGPEAALRQFAAAFGSGDARVLRESAGVGASPTLTQEALDAQRAAAPVSAVTSELDDESGASRKSGLVTYRIDGTPQQLPVTVVESSERAWGLFPTWDVHSQLASLSLSVPSVATAVTVNGAAVDVDASTAPVPVFPGRSDVSAAVPAHLAVSSWNGTLVAGESSGAGLVAGISEEGEAAVEGAVLGWLDDCAGSTSLTPVDCPFRYTAWWVDPTDVRWTLDPSSRSSWASTVDDYGNVSVAGSVEADVSYAYTSTYGMTSAPTRSTGYDSNDYEGTVVFDSQGRATFRMTS